MAVDGADGVVQSLRAVVGRRHMRQQAILNVQELACRRLVA
jgi:hypothetical protein